MAFNEKGIRALSIAILKRDDEILVEKGYDKVKDEYFYRPLGGGIEFGETAEETLKREYLEEIGVKIIVGKRLDVHENIFSYNGNPGHELVFIYEAEFADKNLYKKESFPFIEEQRPGVFAEWVKLLPETKIYPDIVKKFK